MASQSSTITKGVFVAGIYNWPISFTKEERIRSNREYPKYNWCDIDTVNIDNYNKVLEVFKMNSVDCISHRCSRGWHFFGDLLEHTKWQKVWDEIRPYADPRWSPHTLRISKKRQDEVWERPIFHKVVDDPKPWMKSVMHFLCKILRNENPNSLWTAMHDCGIDKYFQNTVYFVELK